MNAGPDLPGRACDVRGHVKLPLGDQLLRLRFAGNEEVHLSSLQGA